MTVVMIGTGGSIVDPSYYTSQAAASATAAANSATSAAASAAAVSGPTGSLLVGFTQSGTGAVARTVQDKGRETVSVKDFGAVGDGTTDDTAAIQAAITATLTATGGSLYFPNGTYKITAKLVIPFSTGWRIFGQSRGGTKIKQFTSNTRIFSLESDLTHSWEISELLFDYNTQQTTANTQAIAIFMGTGTSTANGFYNWQVRRCGFASGFRAIAGDDTNSPAVWGCKVSECVYYPSMAGALFFASPTPAVGQPNITIENCTITTTGAGERAVIISAGDNVILSRLEFLGGSGVTGQINVSSTPALTIIGCKSEQYAFGATNGVLWTFPQSNVKIIGCSMNGFTGTANPTLLSAGTGGRLAIMGFYASSSMTAGNALMHTAADYGAVTEISYTGSFVTDDARAILGPSAAIPRLTDKRQGAAITTTGDASITLTASSDAIQLFGTALTANQTCALPTPTYTGMEFEIVRRAGGAFTLVVTDPVSGNNFTFPSAVQGYVRYRASSLGQWRIVDSSLQATDTGWTTGTGTPNKAAFAAYGGATMSAAYVQAEAQATNDAAKNANQRLLALEAACRAAGIISA